MNLSWKNQQSSASCWDQLPHYPLLLPSPFSLWLLFLFVVVVVVFLLFFFSEQWECCDQVAQSLSTKVLTLLLSAPDCRSAWQSSWSLPFLLSVQDPYGLFVLCHVSARMSSCCDPIWHLLLQASTHTSEVRDLNHPSCRALLVSSYWTETNVSPWLFLCLEATRQKQCKSAGSDIFFSGILHRKGRKIHCTMTISPGPMCRCCALPAQGLVQNILH